uniref:hypothetical protein n=1 Tax=Desulfococcus sp. TaxID=2025834 RepID=UPI003594551F
GRFGSAGGAPAAASDEVPETVVLYPGGSSLMAPRAGRREATGPLPPPPEADDDLPETVVAGKAGLPPGKKPPEAEPEAEDDIAFETVIIRPGGRNDHHRGE